MNDETTDVLDRAPEYVPRIISVDDHVVEPPDLWISRIPKRFGDRVPHVERDRAGMGSKAWKGGEFPFERGAPDGVWCDWWVYEDLQVPLSKVAAAVGFSDVDNEPTTFDEIRPAAWLQADRLIDMDDDHIEASMCYPNLFTRFCGQTFSQQPDKELALLCVRAYNDWMIDEWCAGDGRGRLLPLTLLPLWDVDLAAHEVRRCAEKGSYAVCFSENPHALGFPSIHSGYWDPLFAACEEVQAVLCMHLGSSSRHPATSPDAPLIVSSGLHFTVTAGSVLDFVFAGVLDRHPGLRLMYAESQAGWMPFVFEQADWLWAKREGMSIGSTLPQPPSSYMRGRIFTSVFSDLVALKNLAAIGVDAVCFETDYPHSVATFPHTKSIATKLATDAGLSPEDAYRVFRGNAITAFGLERFGIKE